MIPTISIVIPTRNRRDKLKRTIDTLLAGDTNLFEIVVIDANSNDGTVEMLREYGDRVRWLSERDKGEYDARNKALKLVRGKNLLFAGDDNVIYPSSLAEAATHFQTYPDTDILFGGAYQYNEDSDGIRTLITDKIKVHHNFLPSVFIKSQYPTIMSDAAFVRRNVFDKLGEFDIQITGGDYEFWARAAKAGMVIRQEPIHVLDYILSPDSAVMRKKTKHAIGRLQIARRYGTFSDIMYLLFFFIPEQYLIEMIIKYLPVSFVRSLRKLNWKLKNLLA